MTTKASKSGTKKVTNPNSAGNRGFLWALLALLLVGALVIGLIVYNGRGAQADRLAENTDNVDGVSMDFSDNTITLSKEGGKGDIEARIFEDFACSYCSELSVKTDADMLSAIKDGKVTAEIHPLVFQDGTGENYQPGHSTAGLAATLALAEHGDVQAYWNLRKTLMEEQQNLFRQVGPEELADMAKDFGASKEAVEDIRNNKFEEKAKEVGQANEQWLEDNTGNLSSPRVLIDGKDVEQDKLFNWVEEYTK